MKLLSLHYDKLPHFSVEGAYLMTQLFRETERYGDKELLGAVSEILNRVDINTDAYDKAIVVDILKEVGYHRDTPAIFRVNEGEDFCLKIELEPDKSFEGFNLVARNAKTGALISDPDLMGQTYEDAPIQSVTITDLPFEEGGFYRVHVLLEHPDGGGSASGNASTLLTEATLIVYEEIDNDA